jgi:hypothetical protein
VRRGSPPRRPVAEAGDLVSPPYDVGTNPAYAFSREKKKPPGSAVAEGLQGGWPIPAHGLTIRAVRRLPLLCKGHRLRGATFRVESSVRPRLKLCDLCSFWTNHGFKSSPTNLSNPKLNLTSTRSEPAVSPKPGPTLYSTPLGSSPRNSGKM